MRRAIELSSHAVASGSGGPFGALIVRQGVVLATGHNRVIVDLDPTAHAEVVAIRAASQALQTYDLSGCELFTSCEPCPMCLAAAMWARITRVYFAGTRADAARAGFDDALFYKELAAPVAERSLPLVPLLRAEAQSAFDEWRALEDRAQY